MDKKPQLLIYALSGTAVILIIAALILSVYFSDAGQFSGQSAVESDTLTQPLPDGNSSQGEETSDGPETEITSENPEGEKMTGSEVMEETASEVNPRNEYSASQIKKWVYGEEEAPGKIVFLTFDDGPSLNNTPKVLDILKENGINATFFYYTRYSLEDEKEVVIRTINEGNSIGLHSNCHDYDLLYPDGSADIPFILEDLKNSIEIIRDIVPGFDTSVMRFPGGSKSWDNMDEAKRAVKEWGAESIDWTTMTGDADSGNDDMSPEGLVGMMEHIMSYFPKERLKLHLCTILPGMNVP